MPKLATLADLKAEAARLYRDTLAGRVPPELSGRLGNLLMVCMKAHELADVERRLGDLEERVDREE